jgi:hypothetical protein
MGNHGSSRSRTSARLRMSSAALAVAALATAATFGPGAAGAAAPSAKAASTLNLSDSANLVQNNKKGTELKESGTAKGNLPGKIYIQLKVANTHNVTAKIQVYPNSGGSLSASASASYRVVTSSSASFSGTLNITGGSGRYAKAKGTKLSFSGAVHRPSNSVSVRVAGQISY